MIVQKSRDRPIFNESKHIVFLREKVPSVMKKVWIKLLYTLCHIPWDSRRAARSRPGVAPPVCSTPQNMPGFAMYLWVSRWRLPPQKKNPSSPMPDLCTFPPECRYTLGGKVHPLPDSTRWRSWDNYDNVIWLNTWVPSDMIFSRYSTILNTFITDIGPPFSRGSDFRERSSYGRRR